MDSLASAVVAVARYAAGQGWGRPPQLWALARRTADSPAGREAPAIVSGQDADPLIPIEQDPLPPGEAEEVLAGIRWPQGVEGCVLVTELLVLPPEAEKDAPADPATAEEWAAGQPGRIPARLAVGVLRDGSYTCCLQLRDEKEEQHGQREKEVEFIIAPDLADDLVSALLVTFVPAMTAEPEISPTVG